MSFLLRLLSAIKVTCLFSLFANQEMGIGRSCSDHMRPTKKPTLPLKHTIPTVKHGSGIVH